MARQVAPNGSTEDFTIAGRYAALEPQRSPYLSRARQAAKFTIPSLFPPEGAKGDTLDQPWQSVGARGVNNLAAKLLLALFPPGAAFFKLALDDFMVEQMAQAGTQDARAELDEALGKIERSVMNRFEQTGSRAQLSTLVKHLIVGGNGLLEQLPKDAGFKFHALTDYVVKRDLEGSILEIIVKETLAYDTLPEAVRAMLPEETDEDKKASGDIDLYTYVKRTPRGGWVREQEARGERIPGTRATYPKHKCPYLAERWNAVDGEDYGRGHVEEYIGDLASLDRIVEALVDFAGISSRVLFFVDEGALTRRRAIQDAPNGSILPGRAKDISVLQIEKQADFNTAWSVAQAIQTRVEQAFLLASSIQRQAERVTAEEIRVMAGELEQTLGGVYSVLAQELQLPIVRLIMGQMEREGRLPHLPEGAVSPQIVTGLEGLGRTSDLGRLQAFAAQLLSTFGPEVVAQYVDVEGYMKRLGTALGLDAQGLVRTTAQVQQMMEAQQQAEMAKAIIPQGMKMGADMATAENAPA